MELWDYFQVNDATHAIKAFNFSNWCDTKEIKVNERERERKRENTTENKEQMGFHYIRLSTYIYIYIHGFAYQ